jgi:hypothetical protein
VVGVESGAAGLEGGTAASLDVEGGLDRMSSESAHHAAAPDPASNTIAKDAKSQRQTLLFRGSEAPIAFAFDAAKGCSGAAGND